MAGVKGRSGGPRKNAGGKRPGAGRKPGKKGAEKSANEAAAVVDVTLDRQRHGGSLKRSKADVAPISERDMLTLLQDIALGKVKANSLQVRAAIAAVQYTHAKKGEGGKKEAKQAAAERAANKFAPKTPPRLIVNNTKR